MIRLLCVVMVLGTAISQTVQSSKSGVSAKEQSVFSMEDDTVERPVDIPDGVLQILRKNNYVLNCLKKGESSDEIPGSWFVGSEVHLQGPGETDLVVLPRQLAGTPTENRCLLGANIGPFWIFRQKSTGYELVLEAHVHDLTVLNTRLSGYRNIKASLSTATNHSSLFFKFDGRKYRLAQEKAE